MALSLDGTDDKITHGDIAGLDSTAAFTLMFWLQATTLAVSDGLSSKGSTAWVWLLRTNSATASILEMVIGGTNVGAVPSGTLVAGQWDHYAFVYDGTGAANADRLKIYKNGVSLTLSFTNTIPAAADDGGTDPVAIGTSDQSSAFHAGLFANVKLWTVALSAAEVVAEVLAYHPWRTAGLVLWAPYDDGTAARDYSGKGNHGTVTGAVQVKGPPVGFGAPDE